MSELYETLRRAIGRSAATAPARDPVNQPMIRHWCDAMEDHNPVYTDPQRAAKSLHGGIVAPPAMLNAWTMPGNVPRRAAADDPLSSSLRLLDEAGYTSVVATNSEHVYDRYLRPGDELRGTITLVDVSQEKQTALGRGHFVTTETAYHDQHGERVGSMLFRILKFVPGTGRLASAPDAVAEPPAKRPRPGVIQETRFFWEGLARGELRIQRCEGCGTLHHPPVVRCPACGSYDLGFQVASGRGRVYSHVEVHHPRVPGFAFPLNVSLIELEEGTRLIANVVDIDPEQVEVGMEVEAFVEKPDGEQPLPVFRQRRPPRREQTLRFEEVEVGQALAACPIPITTTLIVAGAIASRDYQDVHHDRDLARERGSPDIFMNILTTSGLCARYVTDHFGPEAVLERLAIRLGAPNHPGDCMTLSARVESKELREGRGLVEVSLRGANRLGDHVTGSIALELPRGAAR